MAELEPTSKPRTKAEADDLLEITTPDGLIPAEVELAGIDGNAFSIMGRVAAGLRRAGNSQETIDSYYEQATAGDYDHLLRVSIVFTEPREATDA